MHVRDWAKAFGGEGKFNELTAKLGDTGEFAQHLKDLGITHVQILPAFDYAQPNSDAKYNWGYNPYHYNVPEGRYVKDMVDGTDAVDQFRDLIKAFHDQEIAVIMDVVYNHTAGTGINSLYDMTVPQYFYRLNADGGYSNGSGCGNEVATNHKMVAKFVIESLKHWMKDYHINGFRFDLMGCHEQEFMKEVYDTLCEIDSQVMVYGEPWQGGGAQTKNATDKTISTGGYGVGAFEDTFRNGIKGGEFGGVEPGHVQGTYKDDDIISGLLGKSGRNKTNGTSKPGLMLSYVECHDNCTLFDKLAIIYLGKKEYKGDLFKAIGNNGLAEVKKQNTLSAAFIFLSQGTPFINGGQEFLRTKQGDHNSYQSDDTINAIDLNFKNKYSDVYDTYKGLIALRKANPTAFGGNTSAIATKLETGVTKYTTGDFLVYFNATKSAKSITTDGYTKVVDVTSGTPTESEELPDSVPAKGFVILKK
jgi:pullulanase